MKIFWFPWLLCLISNSYIVPIRIICFFYNHLLNRAFIHIHIHKKCVIKYVMTFQYISIFLLLILSHLQFGLISWYNSCFVNILSFFLAGIAVISHWVHGRAPGHSYIFIWFYCSWLPTYAFNDDSIIILHDTMVYLTSIAV